MSIVTASSTHQSSAPSTPTVVNFSAGPSGVAAGDYLVAIVNARNVTSLASSGFPDAAWQTILTDSVAAHSPTGGPETTIKSMFLGVYGKFATGTTGTASGSGTWTVAGATSVTVTLLRLTGVNASTPIRASAKANSATTPNVTLTAPNLTGLTSGDESFVVAASTAGPQPWGDSGSCLFGAMPFPAAGGSLARYAAQADVATLEAKIGRKLAHAHSWASGATDGSVTGTWDFSAGFPAVSTNVGPKNDYAQNRLSYLSWFPDRSAGGWPYAVNSDPTAHLNDIANGVHDTVIYNNALAMKAHGEPIVFRPFCEMNGGDHPWEAAYTGYTGTINVPNWISAFIKAWKRIWIITKGTSTDATNEGFVASGTPWTVNPTYTGIALGAQKPATSEPIIGRQMTTTFSDTFNFDPTNSVNQNGNPVVSVFNDSYNGNTYGHKVAMLVNILGNRSTDYTVTKLDGTVGNLPGAHSGSLPAGTPTIKNIAQNWTPGDNTYEDQCISGWANILSGLTQPTLCRMWHEPDTSDWYGDPTYFVPAWRKVYSYMKIHAPNVIFVWCPNGDIGATPPVDHAQYNPGSAYVDWYGVDAYSNQTTQHYTGLSKWYSSYNPTNGTLNPDGKPMMICEWGLAETNTDRMIIFDELKSLLVNNYPDIKAMTYWTTQASSNTGITDQPKGFLSDFQTWAASPYINPTLNWTGSGGGSMTAITQFADAQNVYFHWNTQSSESTAYSRDTMYPGDKFVDIAGTEAYLVPSPDMTSVLTETNLGGTTHKAIKQYSDGTGFAANNVVNPNITGTTGDNVGGNGEGGPRWDSTAADTSPATTRINSYLPGIKSAPNWGLFSWWDGGSGGTKNNTIESYPAAMLTAVQNFVNDPYMNPNINTSFKSLPAGWTVTQQYRWQDVNGSGVNTGTNQMGQVLLHKTATGASVTGPAVKSFGYGKWSTIHFALNGTGTGNVAPQITSATINNLSPNYTASAPDTLTVSATATGTPTPTLSYQWRRDSTTNIGTNSTTYTVVSADVGHTIDCVVTATNGVSPNATRTAGPTAAVTNNTSAPTNNTAANLSPLTGVDVGTTLTGTMGAWTGAVSYRWEFVRVVGATLTTITSGNVNATANQTYAVSAADRGAAIQFRVTAFASANQTGASTVSTSANTNVVPISSTKSYPPPPVYPVFASTPSTINDNNVTQTTGVVVSGNAGQTETNRAVYAIAKYGTNIYVGGAFTGETFGNSTYTRNYLYCVDATTGNVTSWNPNPDGEVRGLHVSSNGYLYVVGAFGNVGPTGSTSARSHVAKYNLTTPGNPTLDTSFIPPNINGGVLCETISSDNAKLYIGGTFTTVGGTPRGWAAALNTTTGALDTSFNPNVVDSTSSTPVEGVRDIEFRPGDTTHVYIAGKFDTIGGSTGTARPGLAELDATTGAVTTWNPDVGGGINGALGHGIAFKSDGSAMFAAFAGAESATSDGNTTLRYEFSPSARNTRTWRAISDGDNNAVATNDQYVFIGHHGDGNQNVSIIDNFGTKKITVVDAATGNGVSDGLGHTTSVWTPATQFNGIKGTYVIVCTDQEILLGGGWSSPTQGYARFPATAPASDFVLEANSLAGTVLTPGQSVQVTVDFTPTVVGARTGTLTITDDSGGVSNSTQAIPLQGNGITSASNADASPISVSFADTIAGSSSAASTVTISNSGNANLIVGTLSLGGTNATEFSISNDLVSNAIIAPGGSQTFSVTFNPASVGSKTGTVNVPSNDPAGTLHVPLSGNAVTGNVPHASLDKTSLTFANIPVGTTSANNSVTITNTGSGPLTVSAVSITGTDASKFAFTFFTLPVTIAAGAQSSIQVRYTPTTSAETASATLNITDNSDNIANSVQTVSLSGNATVSAPGISISPSSINFGNQGVNTTGQPVTITVTNTGNANLVLGTDAIIGTNANDFVIGSDFVSGHTIAPGASATLQISFNPHSPPPIINSFSPISGPVNTTVTITGSGFTGASLVTFNGVNANYSVVSDTSITATVPITATTGLIRVTTAAGNTASSQNFTVT